MDNIIENGNPYGAGRYCFTRSSETSEAMMLGDEAQFDLTCYRWFEYMGCGYAHWRDGKAFQEADDMDLYYFHKEHPAINCRESSYDLEYGNTRDEVAYASFLLMEYVDTRHRFFSFDTENITMAEAMKYVDAIEDWHRTGELNAGPYHGCPEYSSWAE